MKDVELVVESGPERVDVKIELFARLDAAASASAILASSSSAIVTSRFTEKLKGRHRCLVAHPVNPPHVVPIVELSGASWTSPETIARARAIYDSVGQVPIVVKREIDGFILNRMQAVLLSEAMRLVGEGYVSAEDLDKTICGGLGLRWSFMGPFETIELNAPGGIPDYCARYGPSLARQILAEEPRTFEELRERFLRAFPKGDERAMGYAVRMLLPLVQVPVEGALWEFPAQARFALAAIYDRAAAPPAAAPSTRTPQESQGELETVPPAPMDGAPPPPAEDALPPAAAAPASETPPAADALEPGVDTSTNPPEAPK